MFYQNLLNDRQNYNQMISNLKNLLMIRNIKKKNSRFGSNVDINDIGFSILSFEDDNVVGKFKYANRILCQFLNISEDDILDKSVKYLMPELVRTYHQLFVKRFLSEGLPRFIGRVRSVFIKDFTNYVKPVQFFMNFHYDSKFKYYLIMHIDPITNLTLPVNSQNIKINDVIVFLCDNNNNVKNVSLSAKRHLGLFNKIIKVQEEILGRTLKMDDIILNFAKHEQNLMENSTHMNSYQGNGMQGNQMSLIASQIIRAKHFGLYQESNFVACQLMYEQVVYLRNYPGQFSERTYFMVPVSKIPEIETSSMFSSKQQAISNQLQSNLMSSNQYNTNMSSGLFNHSSEIRSGSIDILNAEEKFNSGSHSTLSSSTAGTSTGIGYTKGMLFQQKSPKILNVYLYIVFGVLFSFIAVSSVNFIIFKQKKDLVNLQIQFNQLVNQRNTHLVQTIMNLKTLHLISNAENSVQANQSNIFQQNRFDYYTAKLNENSLLLFDYHEQFMSMLKKSDVLGDPLRVSDYEQIPLSYLGQSYSLYTQINSLDYGIQLLGANIGQIEIKDLLSEKVPINFQELLKNNKYKQAVSGSTNQTKNGTNTTVPSSASQMLRNLFYVFENGLSSLNQLGKEQERTILGNADVTSTDSRLYINLISFLSIGIITVIGVFTLPLLGKIEDRKISVLKFFNLLNIDQIQDMIDKGKEFQDEFHMLGHEMNQNNKNEQDDDADCYEDSYSDVEVVSETKSQTFTIGDKKRRVAIQVDKDSKQNSGQQSIKGIIQSDFSFSHSQRKQKKPNVRIVPGAAKDDHSPNSLTQQHIEEEFKEDSLAQTTDKLKLNIEENNYDSPNDSKAKQQKLNQAFGIDLKPTQSKPQETGQSSKSKKPKPKKREESHDQFTSMRDIHNIFKKIQMNQIKQNEMDGKKKDRTTKAAKSRGQLNELQSAFEINKPTKKSNIMQRDEDGKDIDKTKIGMKKGRVKIGDTSQQHRKQKKNSQGLKDNKVHAIKEEIKEESDESSPSEASNNKAEKKRHGKSKEYQIGAMNMTGVRTNRSAYIQDQVSKIALKEKIKLIFYVLVVLIFLNSNLFACFYLGQRTFSEDSEAIRNLQTFYHRSNCLQNLLAYSQEQLVQNKTITFTKRVNAASFFISECQINEDEYNDLRKSLPPYLSDASSPVDQIKSHQVCELVFKYEDAKRQSCHQVYDKILDRGVTSILYMIYTQVQSNQVRFERETRTQKFINDRLYDTKWKDITDLVNEYLKEIFDFLEVQVSQTALKYFDMLAQIYLILYTTYMGIAVVICFFFVFYVFKKLKEQIITSTNILAIIPMEDLEHKDRVKIESFLNS